MCVKTILTCTSMNFSPWEAEFVEERIAIVNENLLSIL